VLVPVDIRKKTLRFATAYGMSCITNIVRKIKQGKCPYHYVEIMACPKGCNNGGGQLKLGPKLSPAAIGAAGAEQITSSPRDVGNALALATGGAEMDIELDVDVGGSIDSVGYSGSLAIGDSGGGAVTFSDDGTAASAVAETPAELLARVDALYGSLALEVPEENQAAQELYTTWLVSPEVANKALHTTYKRVEDSMIAPQLEQW
jgi:hypothetical protein